MSTNWTSETGNSSSAWGGQTAVFAGDTGGTVSVTASVEIAGLQFATDGYTLAAGGGSLVVADESTEVRIDDGFSATLEVAIHGGGGLAKTGGGKIVLAGNNTYAGGTTLAAGTLELGHNNALGTGVLTIMDGTTLSGSAARNIANDLVVTGDFNVYPGGTIVGFDAFALNGDIDLSGGARTITNISDFGNGDFGEVSFGGVIANGALKLAALPGSYALFRMTGTEANTYTGDTVVGTGVSLNLQKSAGVTAIAGDVYVDDDGVVVIEADEQIADTATVMVTGLGRLQVGAFNDATETIGALSGDGGVALKDDEDGGVLRVGAGVFAGVIEGGVAGGLSLEKYGAGALVLSGDNTYVGDTLVSGGSLLVNGSLADTAVTVAGGALLGGSGSIGGSVTVQNGGVLSPGNSVGILTVGSLTLESGAITHLEINGTGVAGVDYDQIRVNGEATLGGTLELVTGGSYTPRGGDTFVLIDADSITAGSDFEAVNGLGNALKFSATITDDYTLLITATQTEYAAFALTSNQRAVARNLDADWWNPARADLVGALNSLPGASLPAAFDSIAPEEYALLPNIAKRNTRALWAALRHRLGEVRAGATGWSTSGLGHTERTAPLLAAVGDTADALALRALAGEESAKSAPRRGFFVVASGAFGEGEAGDNPGFDFLSGSFLVGVDANLSPDFALGVAAGYDTTHAGPDSGGSINTDTARLALYGTWTSVDGVWVNATGGAAYHWHDAHRDAFGGRASASPDSVEVNSMIETGMDLVRDAWTLTPSLGVDYVRVRTDGFVETGSLAPLAVDASSSDSLRGEVALTLSRRFVGVASVWDGWMRAGWAHEFLDTRDAVRSRFASGAAGDFTVHGNRVRRDTMVLAAGVRATWNETTVFSFGYSGDFNADYHEHSVTASVRLGF